MVLAFASRVLALSQLPLLWISVSTAGDETIREFQRQLSGSWYRTYSSCGNDVSPRRQVKRPLSTKGTRDTADIGIRSPVGDRVPWGGDVLSCLAILPSSSSSSSLEIAVVLYQLPYIPAFPLPFETTANLHLPLPRVAMRPYPPFFLVFHPCTPRGRVHETFQYVSKRRIETFVTRSDTFHP